MKRHLNKGTSAGLLLLVLAVLLPLHVVAGPTNKDKAKSVAKPTIKITHVPPAGQGPDSMDTIGGEVLGAYPQDYRVVVWAFADKWYVQPYIASPYTPIRTGGKWQADTHLGTEYAAMLVKPSYKPPAATGTLPGKGGDIVDVANAKAKP